MARGPSYGDLEASTAITQVTIHELFLISHSVLQCPSLAAGSFFSETRPGWRGWCWLNGCLCRIGSVKVEYLHYTLGRRDQFLTCASGPNPGPLVLALWALPSTQFFGRTRPPGVNYQTGTSLSRECVKKPRHFLLVAAFFDRRVGAIMMEVRRALLSAGLRSMRPMPL